MNIHTFFFFWYVSEYSLWYLMWIVFLIQFWINELFLFLLFFNSIHYYYPTIHSNHLPNFLIYEIDSYSSSGDSSTLEKWIIKYLLDTMDVCLECVRGSHSLTIQGILMRENLHFGRCAFSWKATFQFTVAQFTTRGKMHGYSKGC